MTPSCAALVSSVQRAVGEPPTDEQLAATNALCRVLSERTPLQPAPELCAAEEREFEQFREDNDEDASSAAWNDFGEYDEEFLSAVAAAELEEPPEKQDPGANQLSAAWCDGREQSHGRHDAQSSGKRPWEAEPSHDAAVASIVPDRNVTPESLARVMARAPPESWEEDEY